MPTDAELAAALYRATGGRTHTATPDGARCGASGDFVAVSLDRPAVDCPRCVQLRRLDDAVAVAAELA